MDGKGRSQDAASDVEAVERMRRWLRVAGDARRPPRAREASMMVVGMQVLMLDARSPFGSGWKSPNEGGRRTTGGAERRRTLGRREKTLAVERVSGEDIKSG